MFSKKSLKFKLMLSFGFLALILTCVGTVSVYFLDQAVSSYEHVAEINLQNTVALSQVTGAQKEMAIAVSVLIGSHMSQEDVLKYEKDFDEWIVVRTDAAKDYLNIPFVPGEEDLWKDVETSFKKFSDLSRTMISLSKTENKVDEVKRDEIASGDFVKIREELKEASTGLISFQDTQARFWSSQAKREAKRANTVVLTTAVLGVVTAMLLGFFLAQSLSKSLKTITVNIEQSAEQTSAASAQLSQSSQQLSGGATEAAASLEETVASLEELSSMVRLNADHAREAGTLSAKSQEAAEKGEHQIRELVTAMSEMAKGSKKIEEIISVIDDIAFQTNLLALNAAVEAARAGEQGKGFAVVAEAVRNLAQRSALAAKDITSLIKDSVQKAEHGTVIADSSGAVLKNIVESVKKVADLNNEISTASQEQSSGIAQISKAMNQLDQSTQSNASSSEEVAASAEEMSAQAESLKGLVADLTALVDGAEQTQTYSHGGGSSGPRASGYSHHMSRDKMNGRKAA